MSQKTYEIIRAAADLDLQELERLHSWVLEVIAERQNALNQRKNQKTKRELQMLLEKSGMTWEQFQDAL